jgi:hypothetical protein
MAVTSYHKKLAGQRAQAVMAAIKSLINDGLALVEFHLARDIAGAVSGSPDTTSLYEETGSQTEQDYLDQVTLIANALYQLKDLYLTGDDTKTLLDETAATPAANAANYENLNQT